MAGSSIMKSLIFPSTNSESLRKPPQPTETPRIRPIAAVTAIANAPPKREETPVIRLRYGRGVAIANSEKLNRQNPLESRRVRRPRFLRPGVTASHRTIKM